MTTANKIKNALRGKKLNFVNVEKILKDLGYSVVLFNTPMGDLEITRYGLEYEKSNLKAFTFSQTAHIVFINGALHPDDRMYLAIHELGHIALGHIGEGKIMTRNAILIDMEADHFAHSIIHPNKRGIICVLGYVIMLCVILILSAYINNLRFSTAHLTQIEQQVITTNTVYITKYGDRFHRLGCVYTKDKETTEIQRAVALNNYLPCKVCNP